MSKPRNTEPSRTRDALQSSSQTHALVAGIASKALAGTAPLAVAAEIMDLTLRFVDAHYASMMEVRPDELIVRMCAGVGWKDGYIAGPAATLEMNSSAARMLTDRLLVVDDLQAIPELREIRLLRDHGVVSGVSAVIGSHAGPLGVLGVYTRASRHFTNDEVDFVKAMADLLGAAIERDRLDRQLRQSEASLSATLYSIGDAVIATDDRGRITRMNPVAERLTGWTEAEARSAPLSRVFRIINEDTRADVESPVERVLRAGEIVGLANHTALVDKSGKETPIADSGAPIRASDGTVVGAVLVFRDVGEDRRAEEALRTSEERYRRQSELLGVVLGGVADGVTAHDETGRLFYANDAAARLCGYPNAKALIEAPPGEILSRFEISDETGRPLPVDRLPGRMALLGQDPPPTLMRVRDKVTNTRWWSLVKARAVVDERGKPWMAVNIMHDVSEERKAEASARFLADATQLLSSGLDYTTTLERLAELAVPRLADWCSVEVLEDDQLVTIAVKHVDPKKIELARDFRRRYPMDMNAPTGVPQVIRTGRSELYREIPDELLVARARDQDHLRIMRDLQLRSGLVVPLWARGRVLGALSLVSSELGRNYEKDDLVLAEELGRRAGIAVDNARLYRDATNAIGVRDDFLSIAGHELKTPLAALQLQVGSLRRLLERGGEANLERIGERLGKISNHGTRLERLINELLDVSRITSGRLVVTPEEFDFCALIGEVIERFGDTSASAGCTIQHRLQGPIVGHWDRTRLDHVIANLLSNAIKYGRGRPIEVACWRNDRRVLVSVTDHGIGIEPAHQARIFGRFERAVSERSFGGLGLGLWIAQQIVEAHGGTIRVQSQLGEGATFTVELPHT